MFVTQLWERSQGTLGSLCSHWLWHILAGMCRGLRVTEVIEEHIISAFLCKSCVCFHFWMPG